MKSVWQIQEAKDQLSLIIQNALRHGAQTITKHGQPAVVVVSVEEFKRSRKPKKSLSRFLADSPLADADLYIERLHDTPRPVEL